MKYLIQRQRNPRRRGAAAVMVVVSLTTLLTVAALSVDVGILYNTRADLQRTADSAAISGALALMNENRLKGGTYLTEVLTDSREHVEQYTTLNTVGNTTIVVSGGDIGIGYLRNPDDTSEAVDFGDASRANAVQVKVRRDGVANGPVSLAFAWIFGKKSSGVTASATAALMDGIEGFRWESGSGNPGILPITLRETSWLNLLDGSFTSGDNYSYDPATGAVSPGPDGINEVDFYPGGGAGQLPPGDFGTVDLGPPDNSATDLSRQIREGLNESDMAFFGGEIKFGDDGTLPLNGDTGLSAAIKDDLTAIIGLPRAIPIFSTVAGPGNNATFTIVGWVGIRVMYVKLTGAMSSKKVIIQPAIIVDDSAIVGPSTGSSYFVYQPVRLVR